MAQGIDFANKIMEWAEKAEKDIAKESARFTRLAFNEVIFGSSSYSPIDSGRFVANWNIGAIEDSTFIENRYSNWNEKKADVAMSIDDEFFLRNPVAYMINSTPYADLIENSGWPSGHPKYAPVLEMTLQIPKWGGV